jgi:hypothetical protein
VRINAEIATMARQLRKIMRGSDGERGAIGERGRQLVRARFSWKQVAGAFELVNNWLIGGGPKPDCVAADCVRRFQVWSAIDERSSTVRAWVWHLVVSKL